MSHLATYLNRSAQVLRENTTKILRMSGADEPSRVPRTLFTFRSRADLQNFATGCDGDIGGLSTVNLDLDESPVSAAIGQRATARFWGEMSLRVKPGLESRVRAGYAGFRNKRRPTIFGEVMEDLSQHEYLGLRVRLGGSPRTRDSYFVNLQTDGPVETDLWQHKLYFRRQDGAWEDIFIPLRSFVLTNTGEVSEHQIEMFREKIRSVGISLLGGNSGVAGPYELGIDEIWVANEEDVSIGSKKVPPQTSPQDSAPEKSR